MSFELTSKGWEAYNRMRKIHDEEIARQEREYGKQNTEYGWSCIDDDEHIHNLDDEVDLLIYCYEDTVYEEIADWINQLGDKLDDPYWKGADFTLRDVCNRIRERELLRWVK